MLYRIYIYMQTSITLQNHKLISIYKFYSPFCRIAPWSTCSRWFFSFRLWSLHKVPVQPAGPKHVGLFVVHNQQMSLVQMVLLLKRAVIADVVMDAWQKSVSSWSYNTLFFFSLRLITMLVHVNVTIWILLLQHEILCNTRLIVSIFLSEGLWLFRAEKIGWWTSNFSLWRRYRVSQVLRWNLDLPVINRSDKAFHDRTVL